MVLQETNLKLMNDAQRNIVLTQWQKHQHESHEVDYDVSGEGDILKGFAVDKGVWDPFLASGRYHARFLFYNTRLFYGKTVIEIGSGTGLLGIVMAKYGAKKVIMSDITPESVKNTIKNVKKFNLTNVKVIESDLFEDIHEKADMIIWNIPFFPGNPPKGDTISASMIMSPELFERFLLDSKKYLNPGGVVVVPSYSLGGDLTNPRIVGERLGYHVKTSWQHNSINGIQRGMLYIDELTLNNN
ncbi:MAG: class I SAM-dependent methyltransferase [Candidatus Pacearchaeota archaeon]|jgi:tRNA G10  N-methylase Trm11